MVEFKNIIEQYNTNIICINQAIILYKDALQVSDLAKNQKTKQKLLEEKNRLNPLVNELCIQIIELEGAIQNTEISIDTAQSELNTYSQTIKTEYLDLINDKLMNELSIDFVQAFYD